MKSFWQKRNLPILIAHVPNKKLPLISVVIPVFNQSKAIANVIFSVVKCVDSPFELIIIDDASEDSSLREIENSCLEILNYKLVNFCGYTIYKNRKSKFETYCDYFGFSKSSGQFLLEVQADMVIRDSKFDQRLLKAMEKFPNLMAISGRGTEKLLPIAKEFVNVNETLNLQFFAKVKFWLRFFVNRFNTFHAFKSNKTTFEPPPQPKIFRETPGFETHGNAGRLGPLMSHNLSPNEIQNRILYFGDTVMRGPLFIRKEMYEELGGLLVNHYFLGFDDHDLFYRAFLLKEWRVAYTPINFESPLANGSTRKARTFRQEWLFYKNKARTRKVYQESLLYSLGSKGFPFIAPPWKIENF
jgi:glycosyltransferase involved in cell wall biosynthesis